MFERLLEGRIKEALADTPVVLLVGPRRAGKTTTVRKMGPQRPYFTLDDQTTLDLAKRDPVSFIRSLDICTIDEVQRVPELLLAIKKAVDDDYRPGRFLLTGSANVLTLPRVADSLAGRMEVIRMLPLARVELLDAAPTFLERLFGDGFAEIQEVTIGEDLQKVVLTGGFPEAIARESEQRRQDWALSYLDAILSRDLREIADIERFSELPRFVRLLAQHDAQLINFSELGRGLGVTHKTSQRYVALLEQIYLVKLLAPWSSNAVKRLVKAPKLHFIDSGLLAAVRGITSDRLRSDRTSFGPLLETFVFGEVAKLLAGSSVRASSYHFRSHENREVDLVLERNDGWIAGVEVKASATVSVNDFAGLQKLEEMTGPKFQRGIVLYDGENTIPFSNRMAAVPISTLWH